MYKNVLQSIDDIAIWPVISLIIFFVFFLCLLWWALTTNKTAIQRMKTLPLDAPAEEKDANVNQL